MQLKYPWDKVGISGIAKRGHCCFYTIILCHSGDNFSTKIDNVVINETVKLKCNVCAKMHGGTIYTYIPEQLCAPLVVKYFGMYILANHIYLYHILVTSPEKLIIVYVDVSINTLSYKHDRKNVFIIKQLPWFSRWLHYTVNLMENPAYVGAPRFW